MRRLRSSLLAFAALTPLSAAGGAWAADPVELDVSGQASLATGVSDGDGKADADLEVRVKGSTVFRNGVEIGAVMEGRYDRQQPAQLYAAGRYTSLQIGGPRGVGPSTGDVYLQGAYAYARGGFGEVIVGRDHGVGRTFAVKAPTIFNATNVNDWRADFSGLNDVHTVNDFSGNATKITYLPPANAFGSVLGGLQFGMSYSPELENCGEGRCAPEDRLLITPETLLLNESSGWNDVVEAAMYYQKEIKVGSRDGLLLGLGASYLTADETTRVSSPVFGDYEAYSLGLNLGFRGITIGGSVKSTNSGLINAGDDSYLAFDAGITFKTGEDKGDWGFMLGYGRAEADAIGPNLANPSIFQDTQTAQAGVTYFLGRGITIGAAAQFVESTRPTSAGGQEEAATVVIESSIKF
jgi:hypothetical protein